MMHIHTILSHCWSKIAALSHTFYGWLLAFLAGIIDYFAPHSLVIQLVVAATVMDAVWGIAVSVKEKKFTLSELMRNTVGKLTVYGSALFIFVGLDKFTDSQISTKVIGAVIMLVELWSSSASMLILYPDFPFLKLFQKALSGEIASKLNISPEEVQEVLRKRKSISNNDNEE